PAVRRRGAGVGGLGDGTSGGHGLNPPPLRGGGGDRQPRGGPPAESAPGPVRAGPRPAGLAGPGSRTAGHQGDWLRPAGRRAGTAPRAPRAEGDPDPRAGAMTSRLGPDGRWVVVAIDHPLYSWPCQNLEDRGRLLRLVTDAGADAVIASYGTIR